MASPAHLQRRAARGRTIRGGLSALAGAAFLLLLFLKATGRIDWSWWWVLAPVWMQLAASVLMPTIAFCLAVRSYCIEWSERRRRRES